MPLIDGVEVSSVSPDKHEVEMELLVSKQAEPLSKEDTRHEAEVEYLLSKQAELVSKQDDLAEIAANQQRLGQIKESLGTIIDTMQQNDSLFSRAANFWGNLPLWQKIVGGIVLTVPTLAAGIAAHIGILLAISGVTVVAYTASGIVLDDHHTCNKNVADRLKAGIFNLADILEITIAALDRIRESLAREIDRFRSENERLTKSLNTLEGQVESLTDQVELLVATEELLRESKDKLEHTTEELQKTVDMNDILLKATHEELTAIKKEYAVNKNNLSEKVKELAEVRTTLGLEIQKTKQVAATLNGALQSLSSTVIEDGEQRKSFLDRLEEFLCDEKASFANVAERICGAERELVLVKHELVFVKEELKNSNARYDQLNIRYDQLLHRQELQVDRLEKLEMRRAIPDTPHTATPSQVGFYAIKTKSIPIEGEKTQEQPVL